MASGSGAFEVKGLDRLKKALFEVDAALRKKVIRKANYEASRIPIEAIRNEIDAQGLVETGTMRKKLGSKVLYDKRRDQFRMLVGPKMRTKKQLATYRKKIADRLAKGKKVVIEREPFYSRFLEFGTEDIRARHFIQRAFYASIGRFTDEFVSAATQELDKQLRKMESAKKIA